MLECLCELKSMSPLSFSRATQTKRDTDEPADAHEERIWRERMHQDSDGHVFIPPMALKNCLADVAKFLSQTVAGKGKATYTKHFKAGLMVTEPLMLFSGGKPIMSTDVEGERLFVPADGVAGGSKRVWKIFPTIAEWQATATIIVLDPLLIARPEKIEEHLKHAGQFIGFLRFRPIRGGYYGRFTLEKFEVGKIKAVA